MIASFGDKSTEENFFIQDTKAARKLPKNIFANAKKKLDILDAATSLEDLRAVPGNQLEKLKDDLFGWHSIRINKQWRIIFTWSGNNAHSVKIIDYH